MRAFIRFAAAAAVALSPALAFAGGGSPTGTWRHPDSSQIKFYSCGGGLCAKIVKATNPGERDVNNPDAAKRNRKVQGLVIMSGAKKVSNNNWRGKLYNPDDGSTYTGKVILLSNKELKLQGCALGGLVCKGETLSRIAN